MNIVRLLKLMVMMMMRRRRRRRRRVQMTLFMNTENRTSCLALYKIHQYKYINIKYIHIKYIHIARSRCACAGTFPSRAGVQAQAHITRACVSVCLRAKGWVRWVGEGGGLTKNLRPQT